MTVLFFFFKQKTAYEIRPRDWSSDVCSSDLLQRLEQAIARKQNRLAIAHRPRLGVVVDFVEIVDADKTGERFALGMMRGLRTGDLAAIGRLIQQIREYMRAVDHVNVGAADVINRAISHRDEVEVTVVQYCGH